MPVGEGQEPWYTGHWYNALLHHILHYTVTQIQGWQFLRQHVLFAMGEFNACVSALHCFLLHSSSSEETADADDCTPSLLPSRTNQSVDRRGKSADKATTLCFEMIDDRSYVRRRARGKYLISATRGILHRADRINHADLFK
jgi:hypothetical protein